MEKKEVLCINDIGSLGEYLSKLGVVVPTDKTPESETAKVVKKLLKDMFMLLLKKKKTILKN